MAVVMPLRPADTSREAEQVQIELLRAASIPRRLHLAWSLSATVIGMARRAIGRAHPLSSPEEIGVRFVELHYGRDLAEAVRAELMRRAEVPPAQ